VVHGPGAGLAYVLRDVAGHLVGVGDETHVDDVAVVRCNVPLSGEFASWKKVAPGQNVEVRMPVGRLHGPLDFDRRDAASNATAPPLAPPETLETSVQTIQSIGEAERIRGQGEGNETGGLAAEPVAYPSSGDACPVDTAGDAVAVVAVIGADADAVGMLNGTEHPGVPATTAKSSDAVRSHFKSDKSGVNQLAFSLPARMPKSHSQIVMVLDPCKSRLSWLLFTCFLQVK